MKSISTYEEGCCIYYSGENGCQRKKQFNYKNKDEPLFCSKHKKSGMENKTKINSINSKITNKILEENPSLMITSD